jgi:Nickel responsive protein SCO4226-like
MARVMVEQVFTEPMTDERYAQLAKQVDPCLEIRNGMWRRSSLSKDKLRLVCEFEAPDAESVREALRMAKVPYERVWAADVFAVEDYPEMAAKLAALLEKNASRT